MKPNVLFTSMFALVSSNLFSNCNLLCALNNWTYTKKNIVKLLCFIMNPIFSPAYNWENICSLNIWTYTRKKHCETTFLHNESYFLTCIQFLNVSFMLGQSIDILSSTQFFKIFRFLKGFPIDFKFTLSFVLRYSFTSIDPNTSNFTFLLLYLDALFQDCYS